MPTYIGTIPSYSLEDHIQDFISRTFREFADCFQWKPGPGQDRLVVIKPNWVQESHESKPDVWEPVITHPSIVVSVAEASASMMQGIGTICICDAPHTYANFHEITQKGQLMAKLDRIQQRWPLLKIEVLDLRREIWIRKEQTVLKRFPNGEDPRGYVRLDLGRDSMFYRHSGEGRYYGADYDSRVVNSHHRGETHEYLLAGTPMKCDLFINIAKLKTHKKTGMTCCLKNLVGINGDKNWLPHHTVGSRHNKGDEFRENRPAGVLERHIKKLGMIAATRLPCLGPWTYRKIRNAGKFFLGDSDCIVRNGNWHGNDTCWRMVLDLNRSLLYGNTDATWREAGVPKKCLAIVDGIVGGEGNGPLSPDAVNSGVMMAGDNAAEVDAVACRMMGFDPNAIPMVRESFAEHRWPIATRNLDEIEVEDITSSRKMRLNDVAPSLRGGFKPHFGWMKLQRK